MKYPFNLGSFTTSPPLPPHGLLLHTAQQAGQEQPHLAAQPIAGWELEIRLGPHLTVRLPCPADLAPDPAVFQPWDEEQATAHADKPDRHLTLRVLPVLGGEKLYPCRAAAPVATRTQLTLLPRPMPPLRQLTTVEDLTDLSLEALFRLAHQRNKCLSLQKMNVDGLRLAHLHPLLDFTLIETTVPSTGSNSKTQRDRTNPYYRITDLGTAFLNKLVHSARFLLTPT